MISVIYLVDLYSIVQAEDYFECILKKHEHLADNPSIEINGNRIKSRTVFKIKAGYILKLLTLETIKLLEEYCARR